MRKHPLEMSDDELILQVNSAAENWFGREDLEACKEIFRRLRDAREELQKVS